MRSVQTAGALSEKAKELILFSLVLHSRCHPCFDAHYQKARELGITQAELDEAAWCAIAMGGAPVRMFYQECLRRAQTADRPGSKKKIPERALWLRMILSEVSRITDHLTCLAAMCMETGGFTAFLYFVKAREYLYEVLENVTGARVTYSWTRVGGVRWDAPQEFEAQLKEAIKKVRAVLKDIHGLFNKNRIFLERTVQVGLISKEDAIAYGITGPFLRSTGFNYDVRKAHPYLFYKDMDFEVPLGVNGDNYDRYLVRMLEMEQSMRIIEQALPRLPQGPVMIDDPHLALPPKEEVYNTIEGVINHVKLIFEDIEVPPGEVYSFVESPNGELGFYLISKGDNKPWKMRVHPPCFPIMQALPQILKGLMIADIIPTFGGVNMIGGEMDR